MNAAKSLIKETEFLIAGQESLEIFVNHPNIGLRVTRAFHLFDSGLLLNNLFEIHLNFNSGIKQDKHGLRLPSVVYFDHRSFFLS